MSSSLGGKHKQAGGREITYWAVYGELGDGTVYIGAVFTEPMWTSLGDVNMTRPRNAVPLELQVRSAVLGYIEATEFGTGRQPGPEWIGWRGAIL